MPLGSRPARRSPLHFVAAALITALACAGLVACESEDEPECTKDSECQVITCPNGSEMQTCDDGVCLQGTDCETTSGGW